MNGGNGAWRPDYENDPQTSSWHLDKRLNPTLLGLIGAIMLHAGATIWWTSSFSSRTETRLDSAEKRITLIEDIQRKLAETQSQLAAQIATQAATVQAVAALAGKIDARVDQIYRPNSGSGAR